MQFLTILYFLINVHRITAGVTCGAPPPDEVGQFSKLSAISKYFYYENRMENSFSYTYAEAKETCEKHKLVLAEVTSLTDLRSIQSFATGVQYQYWIGMNDIKNEGDFVESDGITKIKFQAFTGDEPNNEDGEQDCVQVVLADGRLHMDDKSCESNAGVLCQFPKGSYCMVNSFQQNALQDNELVPLGSSTHFYISNVQRTRTEAYAVCLRAGRYLLSFVGRKWNQELTREMKFYMATSELGRETTFWTSGNVLKDSMGGYTGNLLWKGLDKEYNYTSNPHQIEYVWASDEPNNDQISDEDCLDVSYENFNVMSGSPFPVWRASNCLLPKFFICMDLNTTIPYDQLQKMKKDAYREMDQSQDVKILDCNATITFVDPPKLDLSNSFSVDQTLSLMIFALKNDLQSGTRKVNLKSDLAWKRDTIELIFSIFKQSVASEYVSHEFLNMAQEINLMYQNSVTGADKSLNSEEWSGTINPILEKCIQSVKELTFSTVGLKIKYLNSSMDPNNRLTVPQEEADKHINVDKALDVLWYLFSFSLGICYPIAGKSASSWASTYYTFFSTDFIEKLEDKWVMKDGQSVLKQALIFGNFDVFTVMDNLRSATTAAYIQNNIFDRQVVRPIPLEKIKGNKNSLEYPRLNFKTGLSLN